MPDIPILGVPKWVMCMVCGDVIYGGPSAFPLPRECSCKATIVVPKEDRGYVKWKPEEYAKVGATEPDVEYTTEVLEPDVVPVRSSTIDDHYKKHWAKIEERIAHGEEIN